MTQLLDQALKAARSLPAAAQDEIARIVLQLAGADDATPPIVSTAAEKPAKWRRKSLPVLVGFPCSVGGRFLVPA